MNLSIVFDETNPNNNYKIVYSVVYSLHISL